MVTTIAPQAATLACTYCLMPSTYNSDVYRWLVAPNGDTLLEVTNQHYCESADGGTDHAVAVELWLPNRIVMCQHRPDWFGACVVCGVGAE